MTNSQTTPAKRAAAIPAIVVGAGYVGVATAVGLAERGHPVTLVERDPARLSVLAAGAIPFHEPELPAAYAAQFARGMICPNESVPTLTGALAIVCVGTPINDTGTTETSQVEAALDDIVRADGGIVAYVIRSTLPVGSVTRLARRPGVQTDRLFVAPEFLRQGTALADIRRPSRVVIGCAAQDPDLEALELVTGALGHEDATTLVMRAEEASLVKNASNVYLALRLTFANEVATVAEDLGVDVGPVLEGIGLDPRIGSAYLRPSYGFGGSCLPKEVRSLSTAGLDLGLPMHLARAISEANDDHQRRFARRIAEAVGGLAGKRIALLGLAFKADTDDVRSSPSIRLAARLLASGADVHAHDPAAGPNAQRLLPELSIEPTPEAALQGAHAAVIATEWPIYRNLEWAAARDTMEEPVILDGRRILDAARLGSLGFRYHRIGDGSDPSSGY